MTTTFTVPAAELEAALRGVRFAVGDDPGRPALRGVLLDLRGEVLRLVATDRYRLAVSTAAVTRTGQDDVTALVPAAFADDVLTACSAAGEGRTPVQVSLGAEVTVSVAERTLRTAPAGEAFPQWELLTDLQTPHQVTLNVTTLREGALAAATTIRQRDGADYEACAFRVSGDGLVWLSGPGAGDGPDHGTAGGAEDGIGVNREFLLEAVDALDSEYLVLGLNGPYTPLALTSPDRPGALSILMPVRLD